MPKPGIPRELIDALGLPDYVQRLTIVYKNTDYPKAYAQIINKDMKKAEIVIEKDMEDLTDA